MKGFVIRLVATAITFLILPAVIPNSLVAFTGGIQQLVILALLFGVVNAVIKPIVKLLTFPINMLTIGLFGIVINVVLVLLVAWLADEFFQAGLVIGGFPTDGLSLEAILGALIVAVALSIVQAIAGLLAKD